MLTLRQKVAVRRHLGVPFAGTADAGRLYGWRFTWYNEDLEYRMNNMQPPEEQLLTGNSMGSYRIGPSPTVGDLLTYTITDLTPQVITVPYTVQASDFTQPANPVNPSIASPLYSIALNSAQAISQAGRAFGYAGIGVSPADNFSPAFLPPYFAEVEVTGPSPALFTLTASVVGTTNLTVEDPGGISPVNAVVGATPNMPQRTLFGWIAMCDYFAMGFTQVELSTWLTKADVVNFRGDELVARRMKYLECCYQLELAMGGEQYVQKFGGSGGGGGSVA